MTTPTLLPIYTFGKIIGLHPLHIMGVDANIGTAASRVCVEPINQYSWQDADGVSRQELSDAIAEAEDEIARELGYWPATKWDIDERVELEQRPGAWYSSMFDVRGDGMSVKAKHGLIISGGARTKIVIAASQAIVYTDTDSDTYFETATITCATSVTDVEEIALYYPGLDGDDEWQIRPITVSINAGVATIVCRREQLVKQSVLESLDPPTAVAGLDDTNFLTEVDVYRVYNDPGTQVELVWRNGGGCGCDSVDSSCEQCGLSIQTACMTVKNRELGLVTVSPGIYSREDNTYSYESPQVCGRRPDYVRLWYRSGLKDFTSRTPYLTMPRTWQRAVAHLAISKLDRQICSCKGVADAQAHYNTDLRRNVGTREKSTSLKITQYELENNPFGTTIAAMEVWRLVRRESLGIQ